MADPGPIVDWPGPEHLAEIRRRARGAARRFRLPFRSRLWKGVSGNWAGAGIGSSIDFQDHRPYLPGDDLRHINWQAFARTGNYAMKLYREEVSPFVDLTLDASSSMLYVAAKRAVALEAFYFCVESAAASGARLRAHIARGDRIAELDVANLLGSNPRLPPLSGVSDGSRALERVPWRTASLRILVSDCLFAESPDRILHGFATANGRALVLAPASADESDPDWSGTIDFLDVESDRRKLTHADGGLMRKYRDAYKRHFDAWKAACLRRGIAFVMLQAERGLEEALRAEFTRGSGDIDPWV